MRVMSGWAAGVLAASLFASGADGRAGEPISPDPARVRSGHYVVEPQHTRIRFAVSHFGLTTYTGDFAGASGELVLDAAHPEASRVTVHVPTASVSTTNPTLDGELKSAAWLDAGADPDIRFTSERVQLTGPASARVRGVLTLHGVSRPVTLEARFNAAGANPLDGRYTAGFDAVGHIRRSEFGVTTYVPMIGDDVDIAISAAFERAD